MEMPKVADCSVTDCAYNTNKACHALAITVGETPDDPCCDTYFESDLQGGSQDAVAGVGACKSSECQYNEDFECTASNIQVGFKEKNHVDCLTFEAR